MNQERGNGSGCYRTSSEHKVGYIDGVSFRGRQVEYSVIDGMAVFEGDIILGAAEEMEQQREPLRDDAPVSGVQRGIGITGARYRWPNGVVPWEFGAGLTTQRQQDIRDAVAHWEANTFLRFPQRTAANQAGFPDYVRFISGGGCWSYVGRQGGSQDLSLGVGCGGGAAVHEIGHAVGLWHEQSREDRDRFIRIRWENIQDDARHNFEQHISDGDDIGAYDYTSIMHYGAYAFSKNNQPTIEPLQGGVEIGQLSGLSAGDIAAVRALYPEVGPILPDSIATPQELRWRDANGRDIVMLSGYAVFNFGGRSGDWLHRDIQMLIGPTWMRVDNVSATVALASMSNLHEAVNAGWAADNCRWALSGGRVQLLSRLAVRDSDGYIHRVAYSASLTGRLM